MDRDDGAPPPIPLNPKFAQIAPPSLTVQGAVILQKPLCGREGYYNDASCAGEACQPAFDAIISGAGQAGTIFGITVAAPGKVAVVECHIVGGTESIQVAPDQGLVARHMPTGSRGATKSMVW